MLLSGRVARLAQRPLKIGPSPAFVSRRKALLVDDGGKIGRDSIYTAAIKQSLLCEVW